MRTKKPRSKPKELKPLPAATIKKTRVLLVDDHPTMREGLIRVIERELGDGVKRVYDSELPIMARLRRVSQV